MIPEDMYMKRLVSLVLCAALLVGCVSLFTGCGKPKDDGAQIRVYLGDTVFDMDPTDYYADDNAAQVMSLLFEPLFTLDSRGRLKNAAAAGYSVNKAERTIVITLRESYWSDGTRVIAQDFIYAWRDRVMDPNSQNPAAALFYDVENAVAVKNGAEDLYEFGANATGVYEITIKYREGADVNQLLKNLASVATSPVREGSVFNSPYAWSKNTNSATSNGAFKLSVYSPSTGEFVLERNKGYHQSPSAKNYTKNVTPYTLVTFWDENSRAVDLTYEQIENHVIFFMGDASLQTRSEYKKKAKTADTLSTYTYPFNTDNPLFADAKVRYALSLALDRAAMAQAVTFATPATGFLSGHKGLIGGADLARAEQLLAEADLHGAAKKFTLTVNDDVASLALAELAKASWSALGFEVTIEPVNYVENDVKDPATNEMTTIRDSAVQSLLKNAAVGQRDFDVLALDWQTYSADAFVALCAFTSTMNGNGAAYAEDGTATVRGTVAGWSHAEYDALMEQAFAATGKTRTDLLNQAEKLLIEEAPVIPVLYNQNFAFIGSKLKKVELDGFGNFNLTKANLRQYKKYSVSLDDSTEE